VDFERYAAPMGEVAWFQMPPLSSGENYQIWVNRRPKLKSGRALRLPLARLDRPT
jgi:hypothetical protein